MAKIVLNKKYGNFSVSLEALYQLIERDSNIVDTIPFESIRKIRANYIHFKDGYYYDNSEPYYLIKDNTVYMIDKSPEKRDDPVLVNVVEELGEDANAQDKIGSDLKVVEINIGHHIAEHDGYEEICL